MKQTERGQIVVIVALVMTILVAMVGVVIDGGMAWTNRRQVQNAADSAALAGARVLGLDVRWRASGAPNPPGAPFADADAQMCEAINAALGYNTNPGQAIPRIGYAMSDSPDAVYTDNDGNILGQVGNGIPLAAQGVRVNATGQSSTILMSVIGMDTIDLGAGSHGSGRTSRAAARQAHAVRRAEPPHPLCSGLALRGSERERGRVRNVEPDRGFLYWDCTRQLHGGLGRRERPGLVPGANDRRSRSVGSQAPHSGRGSAESDVPRINQRQA